MTTSSGARTAAARTATTWSGAPCVDGDNIVWGTSADGDNVVWGTSADGDNVVWGTAAEGDNVVWGTSALGNIVWSTPLEITT